MNLPGYEFLSAPLWLINTLHHITLTLHLAAMNFMFGGLVTILLGRFDDRWQNPAVQKYVKLLPTAMAATVTLGVAPLLFSQLVYPKQIYSAAITSAWFWLLIVVVAIVAYYLLYGAASNKSDSSRKQLYLWLACAGFLFISYVYSSVFSMAENSEAMQSAYAADQTGLALNPEPGEYIFRWLHMVLGAITVGGFFFGWVAKDNEAGFKAGKLFFLWGMVAASLIGVVYLITLGEHLIPLMRTPGIWALTLGVVLSLGSLHFFFKKKFPAAATMLLVSLLTMVYTRHHVRLLRLGENFDATSLPFEPQWSVLVIFLVCFAGALATVWYMLKLFFKKSD